MALDACLTGVGGLCGQEMYHAELPPWLPREAHHITHFEMVNIVVTPKLWKTQWEHKQITIFCDNMACVQVLQTDRGRDAFLLQCAREIWLLSALYDFTLIVQHRLGHENILAHCLSRWHLGVGYQQRFWHHVGDHLCLEIGVDPRLFKLTENIQYA